MALIDKNIPKINRTTNSGAIAEYSLFVKVRIEITNITKVKNKFPNNSRFFFGVVSPVSFSLNIRIKPNTIPIIIKVIQTTYNKSTQNAPLVNKQLTQREDLLCHV